MKKTIVILIDGINPSQMKKGMPFLSNYAKKHHFSKIFSMLGYSSGIHPSIWTGKYQDEHGMFTTFYFDPKNSPFKWAKFLRILPTNFARKYFLAALKAPYFLVPGFKKYFPKKLSDSIIPLPPAIPAEIAPYFSCKGMLQKTITIFDELKSNGISYSRQSDSKGYFGEYRKLQNMHLTSSRVDFFYFYFGDELGHIHGPMSSQVMKYLSECDRKIQELLEESKSYKTNVLVFSDHGMCDVLYFVDVQGALSKTGMKNGRDYIAFYDSTMARFWPLLPGSRQKILDALKNERGVTFLDKSLLRKYHIDFKDTSRYGDMIFLMDPQTRIFPDYFAPIRGGLKGWHGFDPNFPDSKGIFVTNHRISKSEIEIVELNRYIRSACLQ
jgi:predicted AlkP superfamily pyrophosphatase or phosphodiesterase